MKNKPPLLLIRFVSLLMVALFWGMGMFVIAVFLPPPSPELSVAEIAAVYREGRTSIITGLTMAFVGAGFMLPLYCIALLLFSWPKQKRVFRISQ